MSKQVARYGGVLFLTGVIVLVVLLFAASSYQLSHAEQPPEESGATESVAPIEDDAYSVNQMTDLEKRIEQVQQGAPEEIPAKVPREIRLEADLAACNKKLELLMYSKDDNPR